MAKRKKDTNVRPDRLKYEKDCLYIKNIHPCVITFWKQQFQRGPSHKFALKNNFFSREKTFAFCCFENCKGINFREKGQKTWKTRKFLPAKVVFMSHCYFNPLSARVFFRRFLTIESFLTRFPGTGSTSLQSVAVYHFVRKWKALE